jgi:hypothetical protein
MGWHGLSPGFPIPVVFPPAKLLGIYSADCTCIDRLVESGPGDLFRASLSISQAKQINQRRHFMSILLKVQWVDEAVDEAEQPDPCQRIRHIGGTSGALRWQHSLEQAIESIEHGHFTYYVKQGTRALKLDVGLATNGNKYLKIQTDENPPRLLLNDPVKLESPAEMSLQA